MSEIKNMESNNEESSPPSVSIWELRWRKFKRHRIAFVGFSIVIFLFIIAIFAGFISPYNYKQIHPIYGGSPPQMIHFIRNGKLVNPFVYDIKRKINPETLVVNFVINKDKTYPIELLFHGEEYKFLNIFTTDIHLFGVKHGPFFIFGADEAGRDMFSRICQGARVSLGVAVFATGLYAILGSILGVISGYYGGKIDTVIQRVVEIFLSFPSLPLWLVLSASIPADFPPLYLFASVCLILAFTSWPWLCRDVRAKILAYREEEYVLAAKSVGAGDFTIMLKHLLPQAASHILVSITLRIPGVIIAESALSFLGVGLQPPIVSWGVLLKRAQNIQVLSDYPWLIIPGFFIITTVLALNLLGDGLRDAMDPLSS